MIDLISLKKDLLDIQKLFDIIENNKKEKIKNSKNIPNILIFEINQKNLFLEKKENFEKNINFYFEEIFKIFNIQNIKNIDDFLTFLDKKVNELLESKKIEKEFTEQLKRSIIFFELIKKEIYKIKGELYVE